MKDDQLLSILISIGALWLFTFINTRSMRSVGIVQLVTTIIKMLPLLVLGTAGFLYFNPEHFVPFNRSGEPSFEAVTATAALALWAFLGLESATIPSDKVRNPARTIPMATVAGVAVASLLYISSTMGIMGIILPSELQNSAAPFADAAGQIWGKGASDLIALCAAVACFSALNGWILLQGQFPLAAARDRLFPRAFGKISKTGIPLVGLIIGSMIASLLAVMNHSKGLTGMFTFIIRLATLSCLLPYLFSSMVEWMLVLRRKSQISRKRLAGISLLSLLALLYSLWAVTGLGSETILWGTALLGAGVPMYLYLKKSKG